MKIIAMLARKHAEPRSSKERGSDFGLLRRKRRKSIDHREDIVLGHDEVFVAVHLHLVACIRGKKNAVAFLHLERCAFAVFEQLAVAEAKDFSLARLFFRRVGQQDAAGGLVFGFDAFDQNLVVQRNDFHVARPSRMLSPKSCQQSCQSSGSARSIFSYARIARSMVKSSKCFDTGFGMTLYART